METKTTTDAERSRVMRAVKGRDTGPELHVRRIVHGMGYRYRLHRSDLPGKPDLVFGPRRKVIFVHGCFWHGHTCARGARLPKSNSEYWESKIARNIIRDKDHLDVLKDKGWKALIVWECELGKGGELEERIEKFLGS